MLTWDVTDDAPAKMVDEVLTKAGRTDQLVNVARPWKGRIPQINTFTSRVIRAEIYRTHH